MSACFGLFRLAGCRWVWLLAGRVDGGGGGGRREASDFIFHRTALRNIHRQTRRLLLPSTATCPRSGQSCPVISRALSKELICSGTCGGGQRRGENEGNDMQAAADCQSAIVFYVRGSRVAASQRVRNCEQASFGQTACPVARPRSFGPPLQTRRFPSFSFVFRRFSSFLVVSPALRLCSASNVGSGPPQNFKAGPRHAETSQRQAPRQERDDPATTSKSFQARFAPNRPQQ